MFNSSITKRKRLYEGAKMIRKNNTSSIFLVQRFLHCFYKNDNTMGGVAFDTQISGTSIDKDIATCNYSVYKVLLSLLALTFLGENASTCVIFSNCSMLGGFESIRG